MLIGELRGGASRKQSSVKSDRCVGVSIIASKAMGSTDLLYDAGLIASEEESVAYIGWRCKDATRRYTSEVI